MYIYNYWNTPVRCFSIDPCIFVVMAASQTIFMSTRIYTHTDIT